MPSIKMHLGNFWQVTKKTFAAWNGADPFRQGAIISYFQFLHYW
jgi:hypothetical protein